MQFQRPAESRIEMVPLIDIVFLVLVAFIYASLFTTHKAGLAVDLPEADQARTEQAEVVTLTITDDEGLFLGQRPVGLAELENALVDEIRRRPDVVLFVVADKDARLKRLVKVMDMGRKIGIRQLTIAADRDRQGPLNDLPAGR